MLDPPCCSCMMSLCQSSLIMPHSHFVLAFHAWLHTLLVAHLLVIVDEIPLNPKKSLKSFTVPPRPTAKFDMEPHKSGHI